MIGNVKLQENRKHKDCSKNLKDALSIYINLIFFGMLNECEITWYLKKYGDYNKI
jgi:hypothetical protein